MAAKFGQTGLTDAYVLAFQIPDLLFFLVAGGALSSAFIPVFSEYLHTDRERHAWKIFSVVTTVMSLLIGACIAAAWVFAEPLTLAVAPGKPHDVMPLIAGMSRIILPAQFAFFIGGLMFGVLYARQKFAVPALGPNVYNLGIIFGAIVLSQVVEPGIVGMAWGALVGALIGNILIPLLALKGIGAEFRPSLDVRTEGVGKVFRLMLPVVLGLSLPGVYAMIMRAFGSFYPDGINTALNNANQLMQAPLGIFGQAFAIAAFPALAQFYAQQKMDLFRAQLEKTLRTVIYIGIPISVFLAVLSPQVVFVLLRYGKFTDENAHAVAESLRMFSFGIAAWCMHPVLMRGFFATQNSLKPVLLGTLTTGIFVGLCYLLQPTSLGYLALPLASSISAVFLALTLLSAVARHTGGLRLKGIGLTALKSLLAALICGGVAAVALSYMPSQTGISGNLFALLQVFGFGVGGAWAYYGLTRALRMPETQYLDRAFRRGSRGPEGA